VSWLNGTNEVSATDVLEVVRERLTVREMLSEVGEAAGERMTPGVDDLGVRQDQLDKRHEQPVVRQLVDEEGPVGAALDPCSFEIFLP